MQEYKGIYLKKMKTSNWTKIKIFLAFLIASILALATLVDVVYDIKMDKTLTKIFSREITIEKRIDDLEFELKDRIDPTNIQVGKASWYDYDCDFRVADNGLDHYYFCRTEFCTPERRKTGSCESQQSFTCASKQFKRGIYLKVEILNSKVQTTGIGEDYIICRVNDYVENPDVIIDLSSAAFKELAPLSRGIINVEVEPVDL